MSSAEPQWLAQRGTKTLSKHYWRHLCSCCGLCSSNVRAITEETEFTGSSLGLAVGPRKRQRWRRFSAGLSGGTVSSTDRQEPRRQSMFEEEDNGGWWRKRHSRAGTLTGICKGEDAEELKTSHTLPRVWPLARGQRYPTTPEANKRHGGEKSPKDEQGRGRQGAKQNTAGGRDEKTREVPGHQTATREEIREDWVARTIGVKERLGHRNTKESQIWQNLPNKSRRLKSEVLKGTGRAGIQPALQTRRGFPCWSSG